MKGSKEGDRKKGCSEENDNYSSPLRMTSQGKDDCELNDSQTGDIKNSNKEGYIMNNNEEDHSNDNSKAMENGFEPNNNESILTQILKENEKLLYGKDELLKDKNKLLEN